MSETDDLRDLTAMPRPDMDSMGWDVRAVSANDDETTIGQVRAALAQVGSSG